MTDASQRRLQEAVDLMMERFDRQNMRPMQRKAFLCMAECVSDINASHQATSNCQQNCSVPVERMQHVLQSEIGDLQNRLQRGIANCQDEAKDKMPVNAKHGDTRWEKQLNDFMDKCAVDVIEKHRTLIPQMEIRMKAAMQR